MNYIKNITQKEIYTGTRNFTRFATWGKTWYAITNYSRNALFDGTVTITLEITKTELRK